MLRSLLLSVALLLLPACASHQPIPPSSAAPTTTEPSREVATEDAAAPTEPLTLVTIARQASKQDLESAFVILSDENFQFRERLTLLEQELSDTRKIAISAIDERDRRLVQLEQSNRTQSSQVYQDSVALSTELARVQRLLIQVSAERDSLRATASPSSSTRAFAPIDADQLQRYAENGSYFGQLNQNGVPKTVEVGGYYRTDGTYVRGHFRSPPYSNPR